MSRWEKCRRWMKEKGLNALWLEEEIDIFYLTGMRFSMAKLCIGEKEAFLLVDGRYHAMAKEGASECEVLLYESGKTLPLFQKGEKRIGFDGATLPFARYEALRKGYPEQEWVSFPGPMRSVRVCKEKGELEALQRAADLTWQGYCMLVKELREGVSEAELAWSFERFCRENGASGLAFSPIIAFGEKSAYPHHRASPENRLKKGDIVLIDIGAVVDDYSGDMTRTLFFGEPNQQLLQLQEWVYEAYQIAFAAARPGMLAGELDECVHSYFREKGVDPLFCHGLGHGIGLEVHEYPRLRYNGADRDCPLLCDMVFTIEPGLYLPGVGGIRYENTVVLTQEGAKSLYPK
ncbi:MAG: aminopeptidase P family protein [Verrucomicrobiota bacterium]|nr:aminopeptidase P family protein [Verrucomicrobiota bacterium]